MGTVIISTNAIQLFSIKTIVGAFITIGLILLVHNLFKYSNKTILPIFIILCGVILIGTLILMTLAINTIILNRVWQ